MMLPEWKPKCTRSPPTSNSSSSTVLVTILLLFHAYWFKQCSQYAAVQRMIWTNTAFDTQKNIYKSMLFVGCEDRRSISMCVQDVPKSGILCGDSKPESMYKIVLRPYSTFKGSYLKWRRMGSVVGTRNRPSVTYGRTHVWRSRLYRYLWDFRDIFLDFSGSQIFWDFSDFVWLIFSRRLGLHIRLRLRSGIWLRFRLTKGQKTTEKASKVPKSLSSLENLIKFEKFQYQLYTPLHRDIK